MTSDRMLNSAWRAVILGILFVLGSTGMMMLYQGVLDLLAMHWQSGATPTLASCAIALAIYWLARNRDAFVDA